MQEKPAISSERVSFTNTIPDLVSKWRIIETAEMRSSGLPHDGSVLKGAKICITG